ncbi:MBL fold metallo-hydrolase [Nocardia suismassiliense]|uniref:MBL fold metallo-hydrolase n=1 Tax=Nocardia suismassiliense TaxID=2077092 RepID=UPI000D1E3241|nr:MBL fold metallo-hydrolase [Nocardia suismassiliense]
MRIHHLNCGTLRPPSPRLVNGTGSLFGRGTCVCHCLLIETDRTLVLVDTGIGTRDIAQPVKNLGAEFVWGVHPSLDPAETALQQILRLGFSAGDVGHIVLTHLDIDHTGGLPDFPHAAVHVNTDELAAARRPLTFLERRRYAGASWAHGPKWVEHQAEGAEWFGFRAIRELPGLPAEILLVPLDGHTRGHTGVAIDTGADTGPRWLLHAGDAYDYHGQLDAEPTCPLGLRAFQYALQSNKSSRLHNLERLRELARYGQADIFCAHDPAEFDRYAPQLPTRKSAPVAQL